MKVPKYWQPFQMCKQLIFAIFFFAHISDSPLVSFTYQYFWLFPLISFRHPVVFILHREWVIWSTTRNISFITSHRSCLCVWSAMPEPEAVQITPAPSIHISQHPVPLSLPQNHPVETSSCVSICPRPEYRFHSRHFITSHCIVLCDVTYLYIVYTWYIYI